ncbi:MAG: thymidine kinase [Holosporales bacterium]|nr:thymidine kinase [Holosporales bacterium]
MAKFYFYYAAMNAGKTTLLLQSAYNYKERGMHTLLFTPAIDTRHAKGEISSRIGLTEKAYSFEKNFDFYTYIKEVHAREPVACVFIDEAQFLIRQQVDALSEVVDRQHIPVLTYGLRSDFQGELFEGSARLLTLADVLVELKTICFCGHKACMNMRLDAKGNPVREGEQIEIGGNERYIAVCRQHFKCSVNLSNSQKEKFY